MGFLANNRCHFSQADALQSACGQYPMPVPGTPAAYTCSGWTESPLALQLQRVEPGASATDYVLPTTFASCDAIAAYTDSVSLWVLLACAVVLVGTTRAVYQRIFGNH